jgi:hypothetical protein
MPGPQPSLATMSSKRCRPSSRLVSALSALAVAALCCAAASGCGGARTIIPSAPAASTTPSPVPVESGFLSDYSKLKPTEQFAALQLYRDDSRKGGYRKLLFRPVEVWRGSDRRLEDVSEEDLQYLADALYQAVSGKLSDSFEMVDKPGPDVLDIHLAFTLVTNPDSPIDFFSTAVPIKDLARREGPLVDGTKRFVRDCALEAEFVETEPGATSRKGARKPKRVRAAFFDVRRGNETPKGTVNTWEDVDKVFQKWAVVLDERLQSLRDGTFKPKLTVK